jgi:acetylornithine deacetylase/succinyl-diaminopimelate desuccinylase-like protein
MTPDKTTNPSQPLLDTALKHAEAHQQDHLAELLDFLQIPSVSTRPEHNADTHAAAEWLAQELIAAGLENVRTIPTDGQPLIYADWLNAGPDKPTVLIYGHYDVQPAEPFELWQTPPFAPAIRDNFIYARGSSDDKGQLYIHVKAVEAYLKSNGRLPVNVKFIIEGEEESGGASLAAFIPAHPDLLQADVALISDTAILTPEQPTIIYGLRGMCYMFLDVTGPSRDLHSGSFGGGINNPINAIAHIIAKLKDEDGRILIPGFYDRVRPLSAEERELIARLPLDEAKWLQEAGAARAWGEPEYSLVERLGARPTLDVNGLIGGYTGVGAKTVLPSVARAKISMRLVPDQDPQEVARLFQEYVQQIAPASVKVTVTGGHGAPASITDYSVPAMQAASAAYTSVFGNEPIYMREGGSIPVVSQFQRHLGLETVLMGFGLPGDRIHAPNERFYLPNFYRGIQTSIRFLANYADLEGQ